MENQAQQASGAPQAPAGGTAPKKSSKVWLWIVGGCLAIVIIAGLIMGGLAWWGARKVKRAIKENQPKWEEIQKGAEGWQKDAEEAQKEWQKEMEKLQEQMPDSSDSTTD